MNQPNQTIRYVAMAVTVVALLAISIPFVWQHNVEAEPSVAAGLAVAPSRVARRSDRSAEQDAACMADAKPANMDFKFKDLDGKEVPLSSYQGQGRVAQLLGDVVRPVQSRDPRLRGTASEIQGQADRCWSLG